MSNFIMNENAGGGGNPSSLSRFSGFTLAEMMVVLLIMTIILAAMAPVMTTKMSENKGSQGGSVWRYIDGSGNSDIYYGTRSSQRVVIGQKTAVTTENARLILSSSSDLPNHILLNNGTTHSAQLKAPASDNIGFGYTALSTTTTGYGNIAIGSGVLAKNTTGYGNTGVGYYPLFENTTGYRNTAIGEGALSRNTTGYYNTSVGEASLNNSSTGHENCAIGRQTMGLNITGNNNTAVGNNALFNNQKGSSNVAIGHSACHYIKGSNKVCIANVGPASGSAQAAESDTTERIYIGSLLEMHAGGNAQFKNISSVLVGSATVQTSSDKRLKNVDKEYTLGLDKIKQLKSYNFTYKNDKNKTQRVGVVAQDLQKVFPNAVSKDEKGFLSIRMEDMFYAVINAIKELDAKVTQLLKQESEKDRKIKELEKRIEILEQKIK